MPELVSQVANIGIVGSAVSIVMKLIKDRFGTRSHLSKIITISLALFGGVFIYFFSTTPYWVAFLGILGTASTIYSLIIKK